MCGVDSQIAVLMKSIAVTKPGNLRWWMALGNACHLGFAADCTAEGAWSFHNVWTGGDGNLENLYLFKELVCKYFQHLKTSTKLLENY